MAAIPAPLVQAAVAGDRDALVGLLRLTRPDIRRYARAACRADDVDDAVQEAMLVLARRIRTLRAAASVSAWLFSVVRRECLRLARALRLVAEEGQAEAALATRPEDDLRLDLAAAIESLPPHYRVVVVMRDLEERTVDEMAAALGATREAVKARLHRARGLLREYLLR